MFVQALAVNWEREKTVRKFFACENRSSQWRHFGNVQSLDVETPYRNTNLMAKSFSIATVNIEENKNAESR